MKYWIELRIGIIIILLLLDIALLINGLNSSPDKCKITFNSQTASQRFGNLDRNIFAVNITDLYEGYIKDECPVKWSKENGYTKV